MIIAAGWLAHVISQHTALALVWHIIEIAFLTIPGIVVFNGVDGGLLQSSPPACLDYS